MNSDSTIEVIDNTAPPGGTPVDYTPESVKELVISVGHMLDHFADKKHPGLKEPQNRRRVIHDTGVLVYPKAGGHKNLIGYQLFVTNPTEEQSIGGRSSVVGVIFDLRAYEEIGDRYLFNMLKKLSESVRESHRPTDDRLRELSVRYALTH